MADPVITLPTLPIGHPGQPITFLVEADQPVTWNLVNPPYGATIDGAGNFSWVPGWNQIGANTFGIRAVNATNEWETENVTVTVQNQGPVLQDSPNPLVAHPEQAFPTFRPPVQNEFNDELYFSLYNPPFGLSIDPFSGDINWTPGWDQLGLHSVTVRVRDRQKTLASNSKTYTINVTNDETPNLEPIANKDNIHPGELVTFQVRVIDNTENDPYWLSLDDPPFGALLGQDGYFSWTPDWTHLGVNTITVRLRDRDASKPGKTRSCTVTVTNIAPTIAANGPYTTNAGEFFQFTLPVTGNGEADALNFNLENPPYGPYLDPNSGDFTWTPQTAGDYVISCRVKDPSNTSGSPPTRPVTIHVVAAVLERKGV